MEEGSDGTYLNLGCGKIKWPGWINVDYAEADVNCDLKALPFPDSYADKIVAVHVLEHFWPWEVPGIIAEWRRVLKPGGSIVFELPDMGKVLTHVAIRLQKGENPHPAFSWWAMWGNPNHKRVEMMHKWGYFQADVIALLKDFRDVKSETPRYHFADRDMRITGVK